MTSVVSTDAGWEVAIDAVKGARHPAADTSFSLLSLRDFCRMQPDAESDIYNLGSERIQLDREQESNIISTAHLRSI